MIICGKMRNRGNQVLIAARGGKIKMSATAMATLKIEGG
jgi:hypothetical protein